MSIPHDDDNEGLRANLRARFEQSVTDLDQGTGNRLRLMRREALSAAHARSPAWRLPLVAAAVAALALGLAWQTGTLAPANAPAANPGEDVLATGFPSEEDAELYAWLGEAPVAPAQGKTL